MPSADEILKKLREVMEDKKHVPEMLQAYIVPSTDPHMSEFLSDRDKRREYVTGFTGEGGTAVITMNKALLWVDSRFYIQAERDVDRALWTVMRDGMPNVMPLPKWLAKNLPKNAAIGVDPWLISYAEWDDLTKSLVAGGQRLVAVPQNLVDLIWKYQPEKSQEPIDLYPLDFSGKGWTEKVEEVRYQMLDVGADVVIVTDLDKVAWLYNLRGKDIEYSPVFFAYGVITSKTSHLFVDIERMEVEARFNLTRPNATGAYVIRATLHPYDEIHGFVAKLVKKKKKILISPRTNMALASLIPSSLLISGLTPVAVLKAVKNRVERRGMRRAHIRDGTAMVQFLAWLDYQMGHNKPVTEVSAVDKLEQFRRLQERFVSLTYEPCSCVGHHAAIVHYVPDYRKDVYLTKDQVYLVDSGAHYLDGTTEITRTVHFGTPTAFEKEAYTRCLKGHIALATAVFPAKTKGTALDSFARQYLWEKGMDYGHATGHGLGCYLNVNDGPVGIHYLPNPNDPGVQEGMFFSNEPGYYEEGKFGIRIENIMEVIKAKTDRKFQGRRFLTFDTISFCPFQESLMDLSLLTAEEIDWINEYHSEVRERLSPLLKVYGDDMSLTWLKKATSRIGDGSNGSPRRL